MLTLIVARYAEDVSWVNLVDANVVILHKSQIGNTGRESSSYLWFLANHYHALAGDYLFCQGDPYPHCPDFDYRVGQWARGGPAPQFGARLQCDWNGAPHHPGLELKSVFDYLTGADATWNLPMPKQIEFTAGAQFLRSAEQLHAALGTDFAGRLKLLQDVSHWPTGPWLLERLWDYVLPA